MQRLDDKSRMSGDVHVRFCERLEGRFLRATRRVPRRHAGGRSPPCSHAAQVMGVGPPKPPYRRRLQTTHCCCL